MVVAIILYGLIALLLIASIVEGVLEAKERDIRRAEGEKKEIIGKTK